VLLSKDTFWEWVNMEATISDPQLKFYTLWDLDSPTQELRKANAALSRVDQTRRQLFADISHELRTPLTMIRGEAQVALRGSKKSPAEYKEALQRIHDQAQQLGHLVDDLLFIARTDGGAPHLKQEAVALHTLVGQVCLEAEVLTDPRNIHIHFQTNVKSAMVASDPGRLRQPFVILLENAIRYSKPAGRITVDISPALAGVAVSVIDSGIGIAPDELERAFERFYRGGNGATANPEGSGLGLPVAKAIVDAHSGTIKIASKLNEGTTVTVTLPVARKLQAVA
jgi:two-component system, OmpR family, sensor kinase